MITVRFYAMLKGLAKTETKEYDLDAPLTIRELKALIKKDFPALAPALEGRYILISVNQEFADDSTAVKHGDEVALLPPFSGG